MAMAGHALCSSTSGRVEHTARAARPSVADAGDDEVGLLRSALTAASSISWLGERLRIMRRHRHAVAPGEPLAELLEEGVGVELGVLDEVRGAGRARSRGRGASVTSRGTRRSKSGRRASCGPPHADVDDGGDAAGPLVPQPGRQADQLPARPPAQTIRMSSGASKTWRYVVSSRAPPPPGRRAGALEVGDRAPGMLA